jgi:hypothetical protein
VPRNQMSTLSTPQTPGQAAEDILTLAQRWVTLPKNTSQNLSQTNMQLLALKLTQKGLLKLRKIPLSQHNKRNYRVFSCLY